MITKKEMVLRIDFQDFFENDTVSLYFEDAKIFKDLIVNSDEILGMTDISLEVIKENSNNFVVKNQKTEIKCSPRSNRYFNILVILNAKRNEYEIDISKGKYIGFGKKVNEVYMTQSKEPFEYD